MRIENNNNLTFGAYFKNNQIFKDVYCQGFEKIDKKILDKFTKECPEHEIEIMDRNLNYSKDKYYRIFNNTTNKVNYAHVRENEKPLEAIMTRLLELVDLDEIGFWKKDSTTDAFNILTGAK